MIELIRGKDETLLLEFFSDDTETEPVDLSDATVSVTQSTLPSDPTVTITDALRGRVQVSFTDAQTLAMKKDRPLTFRLKFAYPDDVDDVTPDFTVMAS